MQSTRPTSIVPTGGSARTSFSLVPARAISSRFNSHGHPRSSPHPPRADVRLILGPRARPRCRARRRARAGRARLCPVDPAARTARDGDGRRAHSARPDIDRSPFGPRGRRSDARAAVRPLPRGPAARHRGAVVAEGARLLSPRPGAALHLLRRDRPRERARSLPARGLRPLLRRERVHRLSGLRAAGQAQLALLFAARKARSTEGEDHLPPPRSRRGPPPRDPSPVRRARRAHASDVAAGSRRAAHRGEERESNDPELAPGPDSGARKCRGDIRDSVHRLPAGRSPPGGARVSRDRHRRPAADRGDLRRRRRADRQRSDQNDAPEPDEDGAGEGEAIPGRENVAAFSPITPRHPRRPGRGPTHRGHAPPPFVLGLGE